ncbi:GNAT family N-acetyltransferase [Rhizobium oryziradicis]|uniref:GNAT family N-acetyltransferase n=1 Tax=Rhizobium oryziradicis TaxID=1867956 RepID=A0A1Q8ZX25_9HYPH|nr:GNAT family protein [Rhizobium oryziradicis]OLP46579.1 GNAT family N-acetyltransferase [Rhizobium oryziradicis]
MQDLRNYKVPAPAPVTLAGRFVVIEPFARDQHVQALWDGLGGDQGVNALIRYFPNEDFKGVEDFGDWLEGANASGSLITHVFRAKADDTIVGMASLMRPDPKNGVVEVGSVAHGPAMKRSPLSTEVHYLLARHVFEDLGYRRYEWKCHNDNTPSKITAARYGFTFEGVFRQHMISKGVNRDTAWFSMIDGEWPVLKAAFEAWLDPQNFDENGAQKQRLEDLRAALSAKGAQ